jgi:hypothetical protein
MAMPRRRDLQSVYYAVTWTWDTGPITVYLGSFSSVEDAEEAFNRLDHLALIERAADDFGFFDEELSEEEADEALRAEGALRARDMGAGWWLWEFPPKLQLWELSPEEIQRMPEGIRRYAEGRRR